MIGLPMSGSTTTTESHFEDFGHREVFVMEYDPDEPCVLRAWNTVTDSEDSETEHEVCMMDHVTGGSRDTCVLGTGGEPQAIGQEENQPSTRHEGGPILP